MKRVKDIVSIVALCATATILTGCGGDDDDNSGGAPQQNAPDSINGRTYTLTDAAQGGTIAFEGAANNYTLTQGGGTPENGTFTVDRQGDVVNVTLTDATATTTSLLVMTFTGNGTGTYVLDRPDTAEDVNGSFTQTAGPNPNPNPNPDPDPNPNPDPDPDPNPNPDPGPGTVPAPASLSQITVTTGPGGGIGEGTVYTVNFNGATSGTFTAVNQVGDPMGNGNFTYTPNGNQATLTMVYPDIGDQDNMTLIFTTPPGGGANTYTGTQVVTGTTYPFNGTFTY